MKYAWIAWGALFAAALLAEVLGHSFQDTLGVTGTWITFGAWTIGGPLGLLAVGAYLKKRKAK